MLKNESYLITITAPNEYIFAIEQQWPDTIRKTVEFNFDGVLEFEKNRFEMLSRGLNVCRYGENMTHFTDCFREELWQEFQTYTCLSHMFETLLDSYNDKKLDICIEGQEKEMERQYKFYSRKALNFSIREFSGSNCLMPCLVDLYSSIVSRSKTTDKGNFLFTKSYVTDKSLIF